MNAISPVARPFFRWNHDIIMNCGERGLKGLLSIQLTDTDVNKKMR